MVMAWLRIWYGILVMLKFVNAANVHYFCILVGSQYAKDIYTSVRRAIDTSVRLL